jgi:predicted nucleic acid-binding Zn ribbon protein
MVNKGRPQGRPHPGGKGKKRSARTADAVYRERYTTVGSVLSDYIAGHPEFRYQLKVREALPAWSRISDEYTSRHTEAVMVKDSILYVNTDSSALASELTLRGDELLDRLHRELGTKVLKRIVFKSGRVAGYRKPSPGEEKNAGKSDAAPRLTAGVLKRIENTVGVIREEELRDAMKRFLRVAAQRSKGRGKG